MPRAPVTIAVALLAVAATVLLRNRPDLWFAPLQALVHADAAHLLGDLLALLAVGLWLEPRAGSRRWAAWLACGVAASHLAHAALHPEHAHLLGLSAAVYTAAFAGLCAGAPDGVPGARARLIVATVLTLALADELLRGHSAWRGAFGAHFAAPVAVHAVPSVHAVAAIVGLALGLCVRSAPRSPAAQPSAAR